MPSYMNGILNIQSSMGNSMDFGIRDDLDLNPGTFYETVGKLLNFFEPKFLHLHNVNYGIYLL